MSSWCWCPRTCAYSSRARASRVASILKLDFFDPLKRIPRPSFPSRSGRTPFGHAFYSQGVPEDSLMKAVDQVPELVESVKVIMGQIHEILRDIHSKELPAQASALLARTDHMIVTLEGTITTLTFESSRIRRARPWRVSMPRWRSCAERSNVRTATKVWWTASRELRTRWEVGAARRPGRRPIGGYVARSEYDGRVRCGDWPTPSSAIPTCC